MAALPAPGTPARRSLVAALVLAAFLAYTQLLLRTPVAALFAGLCEGAVISLTAVGLVMVHRTQRFVNFAQLAIGAAGGRVTYTIMDRHHVPFFAALPAGLLIACIVGLAVEMVIIKRFLQAPRLTLTVATIALAGFLPGTSISAVRQVFPILFPNAEASSASQLGTAPPKLPLPGFRFQVGSFPLQFGFAHVFALEATVVCLLLVGLFYRFTRSGTAVRGVAENPERARLLGISVGSLSSLTWVLAALLAATTAILRGALLTPSVAIDVGTDAILLALAAAVVARMDRILVAVWSSILLACLHEAIKVKAPSRESLYDVVVLVVVAGSLLLQRRAGGRSERGADTSWAATEEPRPIPRELLAVPGVRAARYGLAGALVVAVVLVPFLVPTRITVGLATTAILGIVGLSLVVLTGWAGQVSLGQFGFVAAGAVVGGGLMAGHGWPFWFAAPLSAAVGAGLAFLVGLPALRIKGLFLAVTTLAFATAVHSVLFDDRYFGWLLPDKAVPRPKLFIVDFTSETSMYFLCLASLALCLYLVTNLRRSRIGRILIASRENEANLQSFGIRLVRTKLIGFATSGALCGFAGALFAAQQGGISATSFTAERSVTAFSFAVLGGIGNATGALLGAAYSDVLLRYVKSDFLRPLLGPGGLLLLLLVEPSGLIGVINRIRDAGLRIVAQRRQIVVPSLFADVDPRALEQQLVPLGEPIENTGLAALGDTSYLRESELYRGGRRATPLALPAPGGTTSTTTAPRPGGELGAALAVLTSPEEGR